MKTLVLMTCLLTISYAADPQILKTFYDDYASCLEELNVQQWTPEVAKCKMQKDGLIDEQGVIKKEELFAEYDNIISDETNLSQAKEIASTCIDQGE
ncbi:uncharacterized protein LOC115240755 isoform X2 [Formica exsecta]|uniref:uncharacterized protein LOC115240755 isoform X2 n=1 Tax=Formica exsecta TaxID=72781 RepID=UPI001141A3CF|nr:uncharacterized protein LOC115240755 isoform X2 [Formica exsecta]